MFTAISHPMRVLIVDDQGIVRTGLRLLLESQPAITVIGEAATRAEALAAAAREQPDLIVLDLDLGGESGLDCLPAFRTTASAARVLVLTGVRDPALHHQAVCLGAMGLVLKSQAAEVLFQAMARVQAGEVWLEPTLVARVLGERRQGASTQARDAEAATLATLTAREREVTALTSRGLRNKQIADRLCLSEATVRHHLTSIFAKLEVADRIELILYAYRHHLVPPSSEGRTMGSEAVREMCNGRNRP